MKTKVQKWGNSLAVRIPKPFAKEAGLQRETSVEMSIEEGRIVIERTELPEIELETLLEGVTSANIHEEIDTGRSVGKEAW
jgi:antitoxin MazE